MQGKAIEGAIDAALFLSIMVRAMILAVGSGEAMGITMEGEIAIGVSEWYMVWCGMVTFESLPPAVFNVCDGSDFFSKRKPDCLLSTGPPSYLLDTGCGGRSCLLRGHTGLACYTCTKRPRRTMRELMRSDHVEESPGWCLLEALHCKYICAVAALALASSFANKYYPLDSLTTILTVQLCNPSSTHFLDYTIPPPLIHAMGWKTTLAEAVLEYAEGDKRKGDHCDDRQKSRGHDEERTVGKAYRQQRQLKDQKADPRRHLEESERRQNHAHDLAKREQWKRQAYEDMVNGRGNELEDRSYGRR